MSEQPNPKYLKYAKGYAKNLRNPNVEKRRKAAAMIGELAIENPKVIEYLIHLEANDPDPIVRKNAAYSLGMFKALVNALESGDEEAVEHLLAVQQKMAVGKRAKYPPVLINRILMGLSALLALLVVANIAVFLLMGGGEDNGQQPSTVADNNTAQQQSGDLADVLVQQTNAMNDVANILEIKLQPAVDGGQPGDAECPYSYEAPMPIVIDDAQRAANPELAPLADELNVTLERFNAIHVRAQEACQEVALFTVDEATAMLGEVNTFRARAATIQTDVQMVLNPPTATPLPATEAPAVINTETPVPTATEAPNIRTLVGDLYNTIDQATGLRGPSTILNQYWEEAAQNSGETGGCRAPAESIPPPYVLPPGVAEYSPPLAQATVLVNSGLQTIRDGWSEFQTACSQGNIAVLNASGAGLDVATTAREAFDAADILLQQALNNQ